MKKQLYYITIFSALLLGLQWLLTNIVPNGILYSGLPWILMFYWLQFLGLHILSHFAKTYFDTHTALVLLAGVSARLIIAMMAMVLVILIGIEHKELFVINFSIVYLLYLVFEIIMVCSNLRSNLK